MLRQLKKPNTHTPRDSTLRLAGFSIETDDLQRWIAYCNTNPHIENLQLGSTNLTNNDALLLSVGLRSITGEISLVCNAIGNDGAAAIATSLASTWKCDSLNLSFNKIGDIRPIAEALVTNTHLTSLSICNNEEISFTMLEYLLDTIEKYNRTLVTLFFYNNNNSLRGQNYNIISDRFNAHRCSVVSTQRNIAFILCVDALGFAMITDNLISLQILSMF